MDIHKRQSTPRDLARATYEEARRDLVQDNRAKLRSAREALTRLSEARAERLRSSRAARPAPASEDARTDEVDERPAFQRDDRIEISARARALAEGSRTEVEDPALTDPERVERVVELQRRHRTGELNDPESVQRAAERLLGDS